MNYNIFMYIWIYKNKEMILREKTRQKKEKHAAIVADYAKMIKVKGSQKTAIYDELSLIHGVSTSTISRVVNK